MGYGDSLKNGFDTVLLNERAMQRLSSSKDAMKHGFLTLAIAGAASAIGALAIMTLPLAVIMEIVVFIVVLSVYHFLAKFVFGGKATWTQYFSTGSNAAVILWITAVPLLGPMVSGLAGLWFVVVNIAILHHVHRLSWGKAVFCGLILLILIALLALVAGVAFLGGMMGGMFGNGLA